MTQQTTEPTARDSGRLGRVAGWLVIVAGLAVFLFGFSYADGAHLALMGAIGGALLLARIVVALKWNR